MAIYQVWKPVADADDVQQFLAAQLGDPFSVCWSAGSDGSLIVETTEEVATDSFLERILGALRLYPDIEEALPETFNIDVYSSDSAIKGRIAVGRGLYVSGCNIRLDPVQHLTSMDLDEGLTAGSVSAPEVRIPAPEGGGVIFRAAPGAEDYGLTLPTRPPQEEGKFLTSDGTGALSFETPSRAVAAVHTAGGAVSNCKFYAATVTSTDGAAVVPLTVPDRDEPLFTTVLYATATVVRDTPVPGEACWATLRSIAGDLRSVTFNILTGADAASVSTVAAAPPGLEVQALVFGL
jgi:hypothetical protein